MVKFEPGNLFKMPQILKIPELVSLHNPTTCLPACIICIYQLLLGNVLHHYDGCKIGCHSYKPNLG